MLEEDLGLARHLVARHAHDLGCEGQHHLVHVEQSLVQRRAAQPGRTAQRRVEQLDLDYRYGVSYVWTQISGIHTSSTSIELKHKKRESPSSDSHILDRYK